MAVAMQKGGRQLKGDDRQKITGAQGANHRRIPLTLSRIGVSMMTARRALGALALSLALAAGSVQAQLLKQVPSTAMAVVKVNNLQAFSSKLGAFFQQLGVVQMNPDLADPLAAAEKNFGVSQGINAGGDLGMVVFDPDTIKNPDDKENFVVALVPVSDYKKFLANFPDAKTEDGVDTFTEPNKNITLYSASWGEYAAVSPAKELVQLKPDGITVTGPAAKELDAKDICEYANMPVLRTKLIPMMQGEGRDKVIKQLDDKAATDPKVAKFEPLIKVALDQVIAAATQYLTDTNAVTFSANLGSDGIAFTTLSDFAAGSYGANVVATAKSSDATLMTGLPSATKYLYYGGAMLSQDVATKLVNDFTGPIYAEAQKLGDDGKPVTDYIDVLKHVVGSESGVSFGMLVPAGQLGQEAIIQFMAVAHGDAAALATDEATIMQLQGEVSATFNMGPKTTVQATPKAKTVDGVTFDEYQTQINIDPNDPKQAQIGQMMTFMYGPGGATALVGVVDPNDLLVASGLTDDALKTAIDSIKASDDGLGKQPLVQAVAAQLPATRFAVGYFAMDEFVKTLMGYAQSFGFNTGLQPPPEVSPIGMTLSADGTAMRADVYVPSQLVQSMTSMVLQFYLKSTGGQQHQGGL
jgi:hypothetical protein